MAILRKQLIENVRNKVQINSALFYELNWRQRIGSSGLIILTLMTFWGWISFPPEREVVSSEVITKATTTPPVIDTEVLGVASNSASQSAAQPKKDKKGKVASDSAVTLPLEKEQLPEGLDLNPPSRNNQTNNSVEQIKQIAEKIIEKIFPKKDTASIASVESDQILKSTFERELSSRLHYLQYDKRTPADVSKIEREILNQLIDELIIKKYAIELGINITDQELADHYQKAASSYGTESEYLKKIMEIQQIDKDSLLERMKSELFAEKLQLKISVPLSEWLSQQKGKLKIEKRLER